MASARCAADHWLSTTLNVVVLVVYLASSIGPLAMGLLIDRFGYIPVFECVAGLALLAVPFSRWLLAPLSDSAQDYG